MRPGPWSNTPAPHQPQTTPSEASHTGGILANPIGDPEAITSKTKAVPPCGSSGRHVTWLEPAAAHLSHSLTVCLAHDPRSFRGAVPALAPRQLRPGAARTTPRPRSEQRLLAGVLFVRDNLLLAHRLEHGEDELLALVRKSSSDLIVHSLRVNRELEVLAGLITTLAHEGQEAILGVNVNEGVLGAGDDRAKTGRRRRLHVQVLLVVEDVVGVEVALGGAVLAGLRVRHFGDLARAALDHHVAALAELASLDRGGVGRTGVGAREIIVLLRSHF
eukprot:CAMPEP_0182522364 /NCGR_PEP_ID=MMETSP1323-20130603/231_1 /TAXON_ID=236787 /ORGANISM="Florenciella parvula, Strain RCC1693" /LENGTH=274 /DNA_ID=CAMNT_0024730467 /DNA_START=74 /DNA_END=901 /DNA_ORIENTATION=-